MGVVYYYCMNVKCFSVSIGSLYLFMQHITNINKKHEIHIHLYSTLRYNEIAFIGSKRLWTYMTESQSELVRDFIIAAPRHNWNKRGHFGKF